MARFIFDEAEHRYAIMPGSRHVPSVTQEREVDEVKEIEA